MSFILFCSTSIRLEPNQPSDDFTSIISVWASKSRQGFCPHCIPRTQAAEMNQYLVSQSWLSWVLADQPQDEEHLLLCILKTSCRFHRCKEILCAPSALNDQLQVNKNNVVKVTSATLEWTTTRKFYCVGPETQNLKLQYKAKLVSFLWHYTINTDIFLFT